MRIDIQSPHVEVSEELDTLVRNKVNKLSHFFEGIVDAIVYLHKTHEIHEVEIKCNVPAEQLFVKEHGATFGNALDSAVESMTRVVKKYKEKHLKIS